jgi:hypothetical protein
MEPKLDVLGGCIKLGEIKIVEESRQIRVKLEAGVECEQVEINV